MLSRGIRLIRVAVALLAVAAMTACGDDEPAGGAPIEIDLRIRHSAFIPERLEVDEGDTVLFIVRNTDPIAHELIVGDEEVQQIHEEGTETHHGAKPGEISVPAGETRTTTYEFDKAGTLIYGCHLPGHYAFGMKGTIAIEG